MVRLAVVNLSTARFDCTFGRGCDGVCCKDGRPPVYPDEIDRIGAHLDRLVPLMRPDASSVARSHGFMTRRPKSGTTTLRVVGGWCVFFNAGCVLHKLGAMDGDKFRLKPFACGAFPLEQHSTHGWYVRQKGLFGEPWNLPCLDPAVSRVPAAESLTEELALIETTAAAVDVDPPSPSGHL
jgi:hypothetical protein